MFEIWCRENGKEWRVETVDNEAVAIRLRFDLSELAARATDGMIRKTYFIKPVTHGEAVQS